MTKITGWTALLFLAAAGAAGAQCANCGKYHGGAPSAGNLQAAADKKSVEIDSMMKRFQEKEAALKQEYDNRATARIAEIQAQQQVAQAAIAAAKREEILNRKAADAMKKLEAEKVKGAPALDPGEKSAATGQVKTLTGTEAARERMRMKDTNAALEQLKRNDANDRPVPKSIEQVPDKAIFHAVVTPFEVAKQKLTNIFDGARDVRNVVDPTGD